MDPTTGIVVLYQGAGDPRRGGAAAILQVPPQQLIVRARDYHYAYYEEDQAKPSAARTFGRGIHTFQIWLPYLVVAWWPRYGLFLWARPAPLQKVTDPLYELPLPHVHAGMTGGICSGSVGAHAYDGAFAALNTFLTTVFRYGVPALPKRLASVRRESPCAVLAEWETLSQKEALGLASRPATYRDLSLAPRVTRDILASAQHVLDGGS